MAFAGRRRSALPDLEAMAADPCPEAALAAACFVWRRRLVNETLSVDLARRLREHARGIEGLGDDVAQALERLEEDERVHVELAGAVLARLGAAVPEEPAVLPARGEHALVAFARLVLTGLCVCETVSAARFATVREHTDLPFFRACIELFQRDELTHGELGFVLLPEVIARLRAALGEAGAAALLEAELRGALGHLERTVGLGFARRGGPPPPRPQPEGNPGVVEPAMDAVAFYRAIEGEVVPRLEALGLPARRVWAAVVS